MRSIWLLLLGVVASLSAAPAPGDTIEAFTLTGANGGPFRWTPGRTTVITACAFWCDTWKTQLPRVQEAQQSLKGMPIDFLTVSVDGRWSEKGKSSSAGAMLSDPGGRWTSSLGIDRVPYTFVIDRRGVVSFASFGTLRTQELIGKIRDSLNGKTSGGVIYLTFDDFPAKSGNEELLDVLRAEQVPATFFCLGAKVSASTATLRRAAREGHSLQIHSWDHDADRPELKRCVDVLDALGVRPTLYRPPGSQALLKLNGQRVPYPIADPYDFQRPGVKELTRRIALKVRPGSVIQLHAGVEETRNALPVIIASLRKRGFRFEILR